MGRAADARVVAADELLDAVGRLVLRQVEDPRREGREVGLDRRLVLARRRHDPGIPDETPLVELVGVEDETARSLRRPGSGTWPRTPGRGRLVGRLVGVDDVERLGGRVDELDRPGDDAPVRIGPDLVGQAGAGQCGRRGRVERVSSEREPGGRTEQVRPAGAVTRLEGMRP